MDFSDSHLEVRVRLGWLEWVEVVRAVGKGGIPAVYNPKEELIRLAQLLWLVSEIKDHRGMKLYLPRIFRPGAPI